MDIFIAVKWIKRASCRLSFLMGQFQEAICRNGEEIVKSTPSTTKTRVLYSEYEQLATC